MAYFMVTYGEFEITEAYVGKTEQEAITNARPMIARWPEYAAMPNEKIISSLTTGAIKEFDIVKINAPYPCQNLPLETIRSIYDEKSASISY